MFLDSINNNLFRPLVSKNSRLYGLGLWAIYQKLVRDQIEGECTPAEARGVIRRELLMLTQNIEWVIEEGDEQVTEDKTAMATQIYAVLRANGWVVEMDDVGYRRIVYMPLIASRLLIAINSVSASRSLSMGATFQGVYVNLRAVLESPREAASQIAFAANATRSLHDELNTVAASVREISHAMRENKIGAKLFETFFKDFLEGALGSYDHIKITSNPHRYRTETLAAVTALLRDQDKLEIIAATIAQTTDTLDQTVAREQVNQDLNDIFRVFDGVPQLMERIERYRSITTRRTREAMQYAYQALPDLSIKIEAAVNALASIDDDESTLLPAPLMMDEYVSANRCQTPRVKEAEPLPTKHQRGKPNIRDIAFSRAYDDYLKRRADNPERLDAYLIRELNGRNKMSSVDLHVDSLDDLLAFMQLRELLHNCVPEDSPYKALSTKYRVTPIPGKTSDNAFMSAPAINIEVIKN